MAIAYSKKDIFQKTKTVYLWRKTYYLVQTIHFSALHLLKVDICRREGKGTGAGDLSFEHIWCSLPHITLGAAPISLCK